MRAEGSSFRRATTSSLRQIASNEGSRIWMALALLVLISAIATPATLSGRALLTMLPVAAVLAVASIGQSLTIQQGGIDFSVPGVMTMTAVLVTGVSKSSNDRLGIALVISLVVACLIGAANGLAISLLRIPAIISTLAVNALALGAVSSYASASPKQAPSALAKFAIDRTLGVPNAVIVAVIVVAVAVVVQTRMSLGRKFVAIGDNPAAARAIGLPVTRYLIGTYVVAAFCYGLAGIILAGYVVAPNLKLGSPYLLSTITAVVIGGTAFGGGRARLIGAAAAAIFLTQLNSVLSALGAPPSTSLVLQAVAIAVAVAVGPAVAVVRRSRQTRLLARVNPRIGTAGGQQP